MLSEISLEVYKRISLYSLLFISEGDVIILILNLDFWALRTRFLPNTNHHILSSVTFRTWILLNSRQPHSTVNLNNAGIPSSCFRMCLQDPAKYLTHNRHRTGMCKKTDGIPIPRSKSLIRSFLHITLIPPKHNLCNWVAHLSYLGRFKIHWCQHLIPRDVYFWTGQVSLRCTQV